MFAGRHSETMHQSKLPGKLQPTNLKISCMSHTMTRDRNCLLAICRITATSGSELITTMDSRRSWLRIKAASLARRFAGQVAFVGIWFASLDHQGRPSRGSVDVLPLLRLPFATLLCNGLRRTVPRATWYQARSHTECLVPKLYELV
jgi:hypothetical protein